MMTKKSKILAVTILLGLGLQVWAADLCPKSVRVAINKYKAQDYIGCIQDLEEYSEEDPSNAVAYYYTGIAYMNVGMRDKSIEAFNKVATINSVPLLSSYALQATNCMNNDIKPCKYKKYSKSEIDELVQNPAAFFEKKASEPEDVAPEASIEDTTDIDRLIQGKYPDNIHPDARKVIQETKLQQEQDRLNAELNQKAKKINKTNSKDKNSQKKSENIQENNTKLAIDNVSDKEIAQAVRVLSKAGYKFVSPDVSSSNVKVAAENSSKNEVKSETEINRNMYKQMAAQFSMNDEAMQMAMMFGGNTNNNNNSFNSMLPLLLMQEQQNNADGKQQGGRRISPEMLKTMMMSQMMNDFSFDFDNDKNK
ncbi:MAG: hypothetical protein ACI37Z_03920 [Candidatus Gastranaerophilaceae bacterium]